MKEILFVRASSGLYGGIETQIINIAVGLAERGLYRPVLATSAADNPLARRFAALGFDVERVRFKPEGGLVDSIRDLRSIIQRREPSLVQGHMLRESLAARFACLGTNSANLFRIHTYIDCSLIPEAQKLGYHLFDGLSQGLVNGYVSISHDVARELTRRSAIRRSAVHMIPDGVSGHHPAPDFTQPFPLPHRIGMVANLVEVKGHKVLIDALAQLRRRGLDLRSDLFGVDPQGDPGQVSRYQQELLRRAKDAGVDDLITFHGWADDPWAPLAEVPVIVLPSAVEGTPNGLLEAMGRAKVVVGTDIGGTSEFLKLRRTGWIHPARDPEALASCLWDVFNATEDELTDIRREAWETWYSRYSIAACLDAFTALYSSLRI